MLLDAMKPRTPLNIWQDKHPPRGILRATREDFCRQAISSQCLENSGCIHLCVAKALQISYGGWRFARCFQLLLLECNSTEPLSQLTAPKAELGPGVRVPATLPIPQDPGGNLFTGEEIWLSPLAARMLWKLGHTVLPFVA